MEGTNTKKSIFDNPFLSTKVKSAKVKIFPEGALGYLVGPTLALLANSILSGNLNLYMTNVLDIATWAKEFFTWLPVISVIFVVLGNIIVGRLMDHGRSKAGKARPLLLISVPLSILGLLILFVFMPFSTNTVSTESHTIVLILLAVGYNLWFAIAYPFYFTSHSALVSLSTRNGKDRSLLATISNATALAAMGLTSMILPFFLGLLFKNQMDYSTIVANYPDAFGILGADKIPTDLVNIAEQFGGDRLPIANISEALSANVSQYVLADGNAILDQLASYNAWKVFVIALIVITFLGVVVEFYFTRERVTEESFNAAAIEQKKKAIALGQQAKVCFKDKYWWIIIVFFFLYQLGGMMKNTSQLYFCQALFPSATGVYSVATGGAYTGTISIIGAIPTAVGMLIAWPLSNKIGKGRAIMYGAILSVLGGAIGLIFPDNFVLVVVSFVVKALGSTPAMYLSLALLADVLDHQEAEHGFRTDGLTMTIYGAIMAGMTGIATGILNLTLSASGYSVSSVSNEALRAIMPWIFIGGETICYGIIAIIFIFMMVEKHSKDDHEKIVARQKAEAEAAGIEWISPEEKAKREEEEAELASEEARKAELKAYCEKKGLSYEEEEAKYQAALEAKAKAAEEKKAAKEAKKKK